MNPHSSSRPPRNWLLRRSSPDAHWIENSTSSATRSSELWGSGPSRRLKYRSKYVISGHHPRSWAIVGRDADHRQGPVLEEVGDRSHAVDAVRPVPLPDAVVQPEDRPRQQARIVLRYGALAH